jgi:hypothetical protein
MCTITIVPFEHGFRLACNRDERRDRPKALLPAAHRLGSVTSVFPIDPLGPGTWVGVNAFGLAAALLNRTTHPRAGEHRPSRSRGCLLPMLLDCASLPEVLERWARIDSSMFNSYRVVFVHRDEIAVATADRESSWVVQAVLTIPLLFTSSSLGDAAVERPRQDLFDRMFAGTHASWPEAQRRFHRHRWRERPEISVSMERVDAKTVSYTAIDVQPDCVELAYHDLDAHQSKTLPLKTRLTP